MKEQLKDILRVRPISSGDDKVLAKIIRTTLLEFNAAKPGTVYFDESTDRLNDVFRKNRSAYFVAEISGRVVGGGGIYPTLGLPEDTCELVKLYLETSVRGIGIGNILLQTCIQKAKELGYMQVYLETMAELSIAVPMYRKAGFISLSASMGYTGHCGCEIWMLKKIV